MSGISRIAVIGRSEMLLETARALVADGYEVPLIVTARGNETYQAQEEDFEAFSEKTGAQFLFSPKLNTPEGNSLLSKAACDVAVSMNWISMIDSHARAVFPLGVFNAHPGDLPRYRGNACPNWAILNGESNIGLCLHKMVDELDAGPVAARDRFPLTDDTYIGDVYEWLRCRIPEMFLALVRQLEEESVALEDPSGDPAASLRTYPRRPEDSRINWQRPGNDIYRLIRASSRPFSGAYTLLEGADQVTIWRAEPYEPVGPFLAVPGHVIATHDGAPVIATGDGLLRLIEAEIPGRADGQDALDIVQKSLRNRFV